MSASPIRQIGSSGSIGALVGFLFVCALGCAADPLYGARPHPAVVSRRSSPPPRPQVMVATQEAPEKKGEIVPDSPAPAADPVDQQRALNEAVYEGDYLRQKERLFPEHLGRWLAIVNGRLQPVDERGRVQPAATFDECMRAAESADDKALHRFLFRIGEEGDVVYADNAAQPRGVIGASLKSALGIAAAFDARSGELTWTRDGRSTAFKIENDQIELKLADPTGRQSMGLRLADSSGFAGFLLLDATSADLLDAEKFEIPGRLLLTRGGGEQAISQLRRIRVRLQVRELGLDEVVPAGAWAR